jgi:hypothetical protein
MKYNPGAASRTSRNLWALKSGGGRKKTLVYPTIQLFLDAKVEWHLLLLQLAGLEHSHL